MKYKAIFLATVVLLMATPIYAQQKSYIVVETPQTAEPTTVITGQPFTQTYVVRFIDLTDAGEEIIVQEESLGSHKTLGVFEVLDFYIDKQTKQREFLEHIWYLHYTLHVVNPKKSAYEIPPIEVPWKHKKAGQEENDPSVTVNFDFKTEKVQITYVTTIPEKAPSLFVRDDINFGNFEKQAWIWWVVSWFLRAVPLMLLMVALVVARWTSRKEFKTKDAEAVGEIQAGENVKNLSRLKAWLNLRKSIRHLRNCSISSSDQTGDYLRAEAEVVSAIKVFLRTKIHKLSVGSTPRDMAEYISENMDQYSTARDALLKLAQKAVIYQANVETKRTDSSKSIHVEIAELRRILGQLRLYRRAALFVRYGCVKAKNKLVGTLRGFGGRQK